MLRLLNNKRAQNTIEYALIIAVVVGAFTVMQLYNRRAINMRVKKGMDNLPMSVLSQEKVTTLIPAKDQDWQPIFGGRDGSPEANHTQYEPYYYTGHYKMDTTSTEGKEQAAYADKGGQRIMAGRSSQRTGEQEIAGTEHHKD